MPQEIHHYHHSPITTCHRLTHTYNQPAIFTHNKSRKRNKEIKQIHQKKGTSRVTKDIKQTPQEKANPKTPNIKQSVNSPAQRKLITRVEDAIIHHNVPNKRKRLTFNPSDSGNQSLNKSKNSETNQPTNQPNAAAVAEKTRTSITITTEQIDLSTSKTISTTKNHPTDQKTQTTCKNNPRINRNSPSREDSSPNKGNFTVGTNLLPTTSNMIVKNRAHPSPTQ
ncbi:hypothetical protein CHS0354_026078 [Potamilus streckersoni]|uniref:Uncharacterized protein n=1 Tax=Potamilus streckersoni TaxID=2493646 RepID=A0AAE0VX25_9BIVA|nr:hypothetical protein CHS0354_026078 [Potamilus streckersoni]